MCCAMSSPFFCFVFDSFFFHTSFFYLFLFFFFFFSSRRRHTRSLRDWSSDVCSSDLAELIELFAVVREFLTQLLEPSLGRVVGFLLECHFFDFESANRAFRSEERRVGKECRSRWSAYH